RQRRERGVPCGSNERLEGGLGSGLSLGILKESRGEVIGEDHALDVVGELLAVEVSAEVALSDRGLGGRGDEVEPVLFASCEVFAGRTRPIVEFARRGDERATAREIRGGLPG